MKTHPGLGRKQPSSAHHQAVRAAPAEPIGRIGSARDAPGVAKMTGGALTT